MGGMILSKVRPDDRNKRRCTDKIEIIVVSSVSVLRKHFKAWQAEGGAESGLVGK